MISIRNLHKAFGRQVVLDGISLEIPTGTTFSIVGPSGVGKSVLLKLIIGAMRPDAGEIYIEGKCITDARTERQKNEIRASLGVLYQSAALFDSLTVYDNVAFPLRERSRLKRAEVHRRVCEILDGLSLLRYSKRYPEEISIGIRKRVGLARALITEPKCVLIDEPNTGLDPYDGQQVYDLIVDCKSRWGFTGIVISHEIPEVFQVSDQVAMLLNGRIRECCSPEQLLSSEDAAVQQFVKGETNGPIRIQ